MTDTPSPPPFGSPEWAQSINNALANFGNGLAQMYRICQAQGAMGWAFRGNLDQLRATLEALPAEDVREISAAAALLASTADEVLADRQP